MESDDIVKILHWVGTSNVPADPDASPTSGVVRVALEIAAAQAKQGHEVTVAAVSKDSWRRVWQGVTLVGCREVGWAEISLGGKSFDFRQHFAFWRLARAVRYDVVHTHLYPYLRFIPGKVRAIHFHVSPNIDEFGNGMSIEEIARLTRFSSVIIAVSSFVARQLLEGIRTDSFVRVVPNGVGNVVDLPCGRDVFRRQCGISERAFVLLFAGALVEEKGIGVLADAFTKLSDISRDIHLLIAGSSGLWDGALVTTDGIHEQRLRDRLRPLENEGRVHFLGAVAAGEMGRVYVASDVLVVPSLCEEAFSLVSLEGMANGLPVVASDAGALSELVQDDVGLLVPPGDVDSLVEAIEKLREDLSERVALGKQGRQRASEYTWARSARMIEQIYDNVMDTSLERN